MKTLRTLIAGLLCFIAASLSSAGVGGGSLYLPIINLVAGLDLKTASTFSAFMVTGGSLSNVLYTLVFFADPKSSIDYDIALLSEPSMLLGVSAGVLGNVMLPEWLITALFALFLGVSTYKTFEAGFRCWGAESEEVRRSGIIGAQDGEEEEEEPLLLSGEGFQGSIQWRKMVVLVVVWLTFFVLHVVIADKGDKKILQIRPCGVLYWLITLFQVPLAIGFTACILYQNRKMQHQTPDQEKDNQGIIVHSRMKELPAVIFPLAALISGILGGLFGIGGGMLINPVLLQIGIPPQVTASTTSFMVLFSSSMSMVQYLILGMKAVEEAAIFAAVCFFASIVGLVLIQRAVEKFGRASLIVFSVSIVMALSVVSITCFGAIDVWREYKNGEDMGFKLPC
ncbi:uncharacterized protein A4U43_C03F9450 [Asparagus officinalis]|uniref:Sulfite exporter TauE/SafE family protein n=1 Tax=Asparagus officinalis TaxID=4686 RepID=A0A5P1FDU9_ASPOF|nr:uncharacterized protein LOC109833304 [Asparagus officinalis]ONK74720.1 uncharacterized protein A4U43_C03F9450 [Asparagus officinalis]